MSVTAPPHIEPDSFPGQQQGTPWKAVIIGGGLLAAVVTASLMVGGRITIFHKTEQQAPAPQVRLTPNVTPVVRPVEPAPVLIQRPQPLPQPRPQLGLASPNTDLVKARNSPILAYSISPTNAGAATQAKTGAGQSGAAVDPDAIPPSGQPDALESSLTPTKMSGTRISELPNPRWLVEEGRVLPCVQQTRINSTLPGAVTAIIPEEIRGETGDVVVMPKGAKVFGTVQHALINGLDRLAVLWQDITTPVLYDQRGLPHQFRVAVNSPAASELGETGLDGDVDRHLFKKVGGIIGLSLIQGAIQAGVNAASHNGNGNTSVSFNSFQSGGQSAADELLRSWISIPDVMTRDQGLRCSVFVVRDLDFHGAFRLTQQYRSVQ